MPKFSRRAFAGLVTAGLLASVSAGAVMAQEYTKENPLKVAFVVHGTLGDKSFLDSAAAGLERAEAELPVAVTIIEAGADRGRWQPALADATDQGYDVVIGGTWEMTGFMSELAPEYPDTKFIIFDDAPDFSTGSFGNILAINYRVSTAAYLAGYAAAKISETGKLGEILGVEGATILEFAVGFEQGAKAANPDIQVTRAVAGSFTDPAKGKELALAQFAQGVDVDLPDRRRYRHRRPAGCARRGKLAVGVDQRPGRIIFAATDPAQVRRDLHLGGKEGRRLALHRPAADARWHGSIR